MKSSTFAKVAWYFALIELALAAPLSPGSSELEKRGPCELCVWYPADSSIPGDTSGGGICNPVPKGSAGFTIIDPNWGSYSATCSDGDVCYIGLKSPMGGSWVTC